MKTTYMAIALLLLVAVGCVRVSTTGGASSSRTGGLESPTVVRYHVAGFGAAKAGDYLAAPPDIDKFFALGTNSVPGAGGSFDAPLATVFHRGRVFSLVSPTNVWAPFDLLVVENGRILMTVPDGACHLSFSVPDKCVEPDRKAPATVSLEQVLRLREKGKETDVPWLVGILASNLPPWHFHPFAAAQALFQIGTPEAHAALSNHLLRASFPAGPGYHYTAEWNMPEPQRSRFIQQYHLVNLARDFLVQVETEPPGKDKDRFVFVVALENFAGKPVRIREQPVYLGELLYFRDAVGRYATRKHTDTVARKLGPPRWLTLAPRQTHTYRIEARITKTDPLTLETGDMRFELGQPGAFHVCAMVEQAPTPDVTNAWVGRCVSPGTRLDLPRSPLGVVLERNGTDIAAWFVNESREVQTYKGGLGMTSARHSCALTLQSADGREWSANTEPRGDLQNYNDIVVPPGERVFIGRWDLTALRYSEGDLVRGAGQLAFQELPPGRYRVHWWDGVFQLGTPLRSVWMDVEVVGDQPSLVGHFTQKPTAQSLRTIAEDAQYKFAGHDFGNRGEDGDASVYVFHKESGQWARIDLVATRDAVFGRSPDMNKVLLSVGWDHAGLANQNYVRIPLHTSGSILLPDKIEFDADRGLYRLTHGSVYGEHSHPTVLAIRRDDLSAFFAGNRPPVTVAPALRSNFSARDFAAALRGRWESVFALPGSTNIVHAEFRADDTAVVVVAASDAVRTYSGPYRLEFERPPSSNMVTLARITVRDQDGELTLRNVEFCLHNGIFCPERLLLRIFGNPGGTLDRAAPWGETVEGVQVRLRGEKTVWTDAEVPTLQVDARHTGDRMFYAPHSHRLLELELDGRLFVWGGEIVEKSSVFSATRPRENIPLPLWIGWLPKDGNDSLTQLPLAPGKHMIRVALTAEPVDRKEGQSVRAFSNPIEIEIAAVAWGETKDGLRLGIAPSEIALGDDRTFTVQAWFENVGDNPGKVPTGTFGKMAMLQYGDKSFYLFDGLGLRMKRSPLWRTVAPGNRFAEMFTVSLHANIPDGHVLANSKIELPADPAIPMTLRLGWHPGRASPSTEADWRDAKTLTSGAVTVRRQAAGETSKQGGIRWGHPDRGIACGLVSPAANAGVPALQNNVESLNRQIEDFNDQRKPDQGIRPIEQRVARVEYDPATDQWVAYDSNGQSFIVLTRQADGRWKGTRKQEFHELAFSGPGKSHSWGHVTAEFHLDSVTPDAFQGSRGEAVARTQSGLRTEKPVWSAVSEGLRGRLVIAQPRVPAGGRLAATLELENVGKTQWVVRTQNPFDFEARVPDAAGLDIPPTSLRSDVSYTGKFVAIPAGERLSLPVTIESQDGAKGSQVDTTTDIWTLAPGRYGLGGMYGMAVMEEKAPRGTWVGRLTLPVVPFEIVATSADLPGTEKSLIEIAGTTGNGPPWVTPVVVKCRALTDGQAQIGHSGVNHVMQDFLQVEPIVGKEELRPGTGEVFRLHYDYLAPPQFKQRPIRKGEEALWVIEQLAKMGDFSALKVLADTQENRAAVQEVFGDLTLEKRRAVLLEALGERTPMGAELEHRLRWVLRDVRHFSAKFRRGAVPADTAGAERAADGRHYVRTAITLDRLAGGPVTENWVRQLTTHIAQGNRVEELEIRVADPVASTWAAMILAMQAGDKAALAKTCTEKGYQSVVKGFRNKEAGAKDLQSWGWAWSNLPLLSRRQTAAGVMLSMGSDVKTFGFEFVETPDGWKLDRWEQAK